VRAIAESCGELADFVRLIWEGLNFEFREIPRGEVVIYRGVELSDAALGSYRDRVGRLFAWPTFTSFTEQREVAEEYGRAWRGGIPVIFELRSLLCPRLRNGTYLLHPFAYLQVEAVVGNAVKLAEVELLGPASMPGPPGQHPDAMPRRGTLTELHRAAECGDIRAIGRLVRPELINGREADGWTALAVASCCGKVEAVKALASLGADVNTAMKDGATSVYVAAQNGHVEVVKALASLGADVNATDNEGATPVYVAARQGHLEVVKALASLNADVSTPNEIGATPVSIASRHGHLEMVKALASLGAKVDVAKHNGVTPVFIAAQEGHVHVVNALAALGADVRVPNKNGLTPVFIAARQGHLEVVKALAASGVDVNARANDGATPFLVAAYTGHLEVMKALAALGAVLEVRMKDGATPMFMAAAMGHDRVVGALVALGADVNVRRTERKWTQWYIDRFHLDAGDEGDWTPLMIAARNGHVEVVKLLLEAGASAGVTLSDGRTALSLANAMGHAGVAAVLAGL
jgi:ankyrin repeat protein